MAPDTRQSQFHWRISFGFLAALILGVVPLATANGAESEGEASWHTPYRGEPFFLLSDSSYGSTEVAKVRLEVPGRNFSSLAEYGGVDIVLYRIANPIEFLKKQKNLHRIETNGKYVGEGLGNALGFVWDDWYKKSRRKWQDIFTSEARQGVVRQAPELRTSPALNRPTEFSNPPQFAPLPETNGFHLVDRYRYPIAQAKPIQPPEGVKLDGSSSDFQMSLEGNVYIPLGKRKPGLYLVEAIIGGHRATTLVFISDTVAITKASSGQMMAWVVRRDTGSIERNVQLIWTDGVGVLASGNTDARGIASFDKAAPEKSYVIGVDGQGGVLISENFYYDSEIYNTKIYAVTDRPLYRPGDEVNVKFLGLNFRSALQSEAMAPGSIGLEVLDPNGTPVTAQKLQVSAQNGAQTVFRLPESASAGGYELRYTYKDDVYTAAFRVADYIKPHFEISVLPGKDNYKTNETIEGRFVLTYPNGSPVKNADVQFTVRAQATTMVEGELQYTGLFPIKLQTENAVTDDTGEVRFSLPPAKDPSRYVLTVFASDAAAYRVKATKELLIERSASAFMLHAVEQFSQPGQVVQFNFEAVAGNQTNNLPVRYELVRLETQKKSGGTIAGSAGNFQINFAESGSYSILLYDAGGNILGACSHWVSGDGLKAVKGSIEIVFDRANYKAGETAQALITFPEPVDSALLTLERDRVEQSSLLQAAGNWVSAQRITPTQWKASVSVNETFAPNLTFSVAYVKNGEWVFQNRGILVEQPRIQVQFKTDKEVYRPGETVKVQLETSIEGKPVPANVSVGVVDEMIYVLQPEIAPNIVDFFYHPRRNNVRTHSSLQFIGYDMASYRQEAAPARGSSHERGIKVLERPRRDNIDTAYWNGRISTDSAGRASFTFVMPDSLTRWRITGRAMSAQGMVGQRTAYIRSEKPYYAKWISPNWMRSSDAPVAMLAVFNQTEQEREVNIQISGGGLKLSRALRTQRGINSLPVELAGYSGDTLHVEVWADNRLEDSLDVAMKRDGLIWKSPSTLVLPVDSKQVALNLPKDAENIRVSFANGAAQQFSRIVDGLDEYPYGCVEQTASRMLPLAYALQSLPQDTGGERARITWQLRQRLQQQRLRLVYMSGPDATFGWWGNSTQDDLLLTAYAYYADHTASRVLGLGMPDEHWEKLLNMFGRAGDRESAQLPLHRALALWMANDMGLPTRTLVSGLLDDLGKQAPLTGRGLADGRSSPAFAAPDGDLARAMTVELAALLAARNQLPLPPQLAAALPVASAQLEQSGLPSAQALQLLASKAPDRMQAAERILNAVRAEMSTFDRALALIWLNKLLAGKVGESSGVALDNAWVRGSSVTGADIWKLKGNGVPGVLTLLQAPVKPLTAYVQYESASQEAASLPIQMVRKLYRLVASSDGNSGLGAERVQQFSLRERANNEAINSNELYLEEIRLTPENGSRVKYGMVEVPLPPGAAVEGTTWGIMVGQGEALERARNEPTREGYAVPVENLDQPVVLRHLLRFSQKGKYVVPPARFYSMYAPQNKALEAGGKFQMLEVR